MLLKMLLEDLIEYIDSTIRSKDLPLIEDIPPGEYKNIRKYIDELNKKIEPDLNHCLGTPYKNK